MNISLLYHPYLRQTSRREFQVDEPISVADFCKRFNIPLIIKPHRKHGIGSPKSIIRVNKCSVTDQHVMREDSSITIMDTWLFPAGPWIPERGFKAYLEELLAEGKGISGYPPFEELFDYEKDRLP